jgi:nucleotide-binding universal stress UspA family protein
MYTRIVVPLDGSDIAELALLEAESLASLIEAPVHLVRVTDLTTRELTSVYGLASPSAVSTLLVDEADAATQYLESVARALAGRGLRVTTEVRRGPVAEELIAVAKPGDLYVMASHGRSGIARWFMGSIAEDVVRRSSVPVLLVKISSYTGRQTGNGHALVQDVPAATAALS